MLSNVLLRHRQNLSCDNDNQMIFLFGLFHCYFSGYPIACILEAVPKNIRSNIQLHPCYDVGSSKEG